MIGRYILFTLGSILLGILSTTSIANAQASFGVRAGGSFQNLNGQYENGDNISNDITPCFHAGIELEIPVVSGYYFQPGLLFSIKGADNVFEIKGQKASIYYIELPLHLAFKPRLGKGRLVLGLGPYLAYGIAGNFEFAGGKEKIVFENKITPSEYESGVPYLQPIDAGADFFVGYQFAFGIIVQLYGQLGLVNLKPKIEGEITDAVFRNTGFGISLGYHF